MSAATEINLCFTGSAHLGKGAGCQDQTLVKQLEQGLWCAAVSDGMGSCANGGIGAKIAAKAVAHAAKGSAERDMEAIDAEAMLRTGVSRAKKILKAEANKRYQPLRSYGATLTSVLYDANLKQLAFAQVGDSGCICLGSDGRLFMAAQPQNGRRSNQTYAYATAPPGKLEVGTHHSVEAFMLATDGVLAALTTKKNGVVVPNDAAALVMRVLLEGTADEARDALADYLARSASVFAGITDDKSLVAVVPSEARKIANVLDAAEPRQVVAMQKPPKRRFFPVWTPRHSANSRVSVRTQVTPRVRVKEA